MVLFSSTLRLGTLVTIDLKVERLSVMRAKIQDLSIKGLD